MFLRRALQALIRSPVPIVGVTFGQTTFEGSTVGSRSGLYDLACTDATGSHFLVEMQVSAYPQLLQRMKFYAFTKFNTLIQRGNFSFDELPRIYCVGTLQHSIFPHLPGYHQLAQLRFITVELDKFDEKAPITTDLEKLLHPMKTLHKTPSTDHFPPFYREEWIKAALEELDRNNLTPDDRMHLGMSLARESPELYVQKQRWPQP